jgi:nucleoside-triphosphatase
LKKRILLLTGVPGVGKTSVLMKIVESLKAGGYSVGGMVSREVRVGTDRVGFEILDLKTGRKGWLARVGQNQGPCVGRYQVNLEEIRSIGAKAIATAVTDSDIIVIDEIGPMELHSSEFKEAVKRAAESPKLIVGVVHWHASDRLVTELRERSDVEVHAVTLENRTNLNELVFAKAIDFLSARSGSKAPTP